MTLQRYKTKAEALARIKELEAEVKHGADRIGWLESENAQAVRRIGELEARLEPCDVCKSIDCEDASKDYYIKRWKECEARVGELEADKESVKKSLDDLKVCFATCRDATATCVSDYSTGMANGIEWALSCLELREPNYLDCGRKAKEISGEPVIGEQLRQKVGK